MPEHETIRPLTEREKALLHQVWPDYARTDATVRRAVQEHETNRRHLRALIDALAGAEHAGPQTDVDVDLAAGTLVRVNVAAPTGGE